MNHRNFLRPCLVFIAAAFHSAVAADVHTITIPPPPPETEGYKMGEPRRPDGATLTLDSHSLLLDGQPWTPVMGEFHYTRYPENEWREELLKMKAGGIDIVVHLRFLDSSRGNRRPVRLDRPPQSARASSSSAGEVGLR